MCIRDSARILCYDIRELDEQLRPVGMVVTLDAIFNRVIRNWRQGKRTWILADEFYILFRYSFSAEFFYRLFKRMRKYNAFITAVSQNVDEILRSDTARLMLANSELLVMLNQAATDREELAKLLNISENQLSYITNVPAGHGLIPVSYTHLVLPPQMDGGEREALKMFRYKIVAGALSVHAAHKERLVSASDFLCHFAGLLSFKSPFSGNTWLVSARVSWSIAVARLSAQPIYCPAGPWMEMRPTAG